jgi:RNA polymerase sigma-70 factor (ECF subfamily)
VDDAQRHTLLETWFRDHADRVLAYLLHRTDPETAQDVLQEVFVIAFRRAAVVPEPPIGWLLATARRTLANARRSERRRDRLAARVAATSAPPLGADGSDGDPGVLAALARLSPGDREVLTLSAWYDLPAEEAARALQCSTGAYRVRLHRARRRLADALTGPAAAGVAAVVTEGVPDVR